MTRAYQLPPDPGASQKLAKPDKFIVLFCLSKTAQKTLPFLESPTSGGLGLRSENFVPVQEFLSGSKALKISYECPIFVKSHEAGAEGRVSRLLTTENLRLGVSLTKRTLFHFPSDCLMMSYEFSVSDLKVTDSGDGAALYGEFEAELFRCAEEIFKETKAADPDLGEKTILNWRYAYSVFYGNPDPSAFPLDRSSADLDAFLKIEPAIKKEFVRSNVFTWEYAYLNLPKASDHKEADVVSLVSYQCFLYYQLEQMQKETAALVQEIQQSFLHRRRKEMDRLIDRSVLMRLEVNKLTDSYVVDRVTYARDYQAILRQLEISFESDRKMKLLQSASQEMVGLVKHVNDIIEVRTSGVIQKVLVALAFYALPGAITDSATFIGILPESEGPSVRGLLFIGLVVCMVGIPYLSIRFRAKFFGDS
ncbi:MAG TPA: hypothetical protein PL182_10430 [Pseudobdellovibrionaceae bacterium]|nr:hypothetical protein [Pseudobdellovibrionaceae bacterium]